MSKAPDIFDEISPDKDIFDEVESDPPKPDVFDETDEIAALVKAEVRKIRPLYIPVPQPPQKVKEIVKEVVIREIAKEEKKDERVYAEAATVQALEKRIKELTDQLDSYRQSMAFMGGSGVIGIPPPEGNENKVLTVKSNRATWKTGASVSSDAYTTSNVTTTRTLDPTTSTIDNLYNVVASLIQTLQGAGIIQ